MKCVILKNLPTTTKIESLPFFNLSKPKTKSIEIFAQGIVGIGNGVYSLYDYTLDFSFLYAMHCSHIRCTPLFIFGQKQCSNNTSKVFATLK
jgi:hypothetical protein